MGLLSFITYGCTEANWNSSASSVKGSLLQMKAKAKPSIILLHRMFNPSSLFLSLLFNIRRLILPRFVC